MKTFNMPLYDIACHCCMSLCIDLDGLTEVTLILAPSAGSRMLEGHQKEKKEPGLTRWQTDKGQHPSAM